MLLIYDDPRFDRHEPGPQHPERPERLQAARAGLAGLSWTGRTPKPAGRDALLRVHTVEHVDRVLACAGQTVQLDADTATSPGSVDAALLGAGAALLAADDLLAGAPAFVLSRPPGHHATRSRAMGFCLFNNAALAADHLARAGERVLVFDPDVHHGNGTQDIFWDRSDVLYVSTHRWPYYPGTGRAEEIGGADGLGATLNVPMPPGAGPGHLLEAMTQRVMPAVRRFGPTVAVISAGFDALAGDPLADGAFTVEALAAAWAMVRSEVPCMAVLEGGYSLANLQAGVAGCAPVLAGARPETPAYPREPGWGAVMASWAHPLLDGAA